MTFVRLVSSSKLIKLLLLGGVATALSGTGGHRRQPFYALPIPRTQKATPVGDFIAAHLPERPAIGDAIEIGLIWLVVHDVDRERITRVVLVIT
jgi:hypothetical protein